MTVTPNERPDPNQLLLTGGRAPEAVDFGPSPGLTITGTLLSGPTTYQPREYDKNNPGQGPLRFWPDGNPVYAVYLDIDVAGIGIRRLYVEKQRMTSAIQQAMLRAGVHKVEPGGQLSIMWTGTEQGAGNLPANTYAATYQRPSAQPLADKILSNGGPIPQQASSGPAPWQQGVPGVQLPAYMPSPAPVQAPVSQGPPTQLPQTPTLPQVQPSAAPVLTETIAAAMRNAGIPTDGYVIIPG